MYENYLNSEKSLFFFDDFCLCAYPFWICTRIRIWSRRVTNTVPDPDPPIVPDPCFSGSGAGSGSKTLLTTVVNLLMDCELLMEEIRKFVCNSASFL
jgi:hypothetical protein